VIDRSLVIAGVASILGHFLLGEALSTLPPREPPKYDRKIEVRVVAPPPKPEPPPPEPEKPPEPKPPDPKPEPKVVREKPTSKPVQALVHDVISKDVPIADHAVIATESNEQPVFGVTMESTSQGGKTTAAVGNTTNPAAGPAATAPVKQVAAPVAAYEVTKMPLPQGRCSGKYTDEARAAAVEGTVVLDLIVDESGRAREIQVVSGLEHGLTAAAIAALKECRFSPGEKDGKAVPVRVRGFKIRFVMADAQ
jgi:TonB family protein